MYVATCIHWWNVGMGRDYRTPYLLASWIISCLTYSTIILLWFVLQPSGPCAFDNTTAAIASVQPESSRMFEFSITTILDTEFLTALLLFNVDDITLAYRAFYIVHNESSRIEVVSILKLKC